jgi:polar amino acid transport system substrate-binding protein
MQLYKIVILLSLLCSLGSTKELVLTEQENAFIAAHPVLRVQNERIWAPIDFREEGVAKGYAVDYIQLLASKAGFKVEFIPGHSWSTYLKMLENRELDIISSIKLTEQRKNYINFTKRPIAKLISGVLQRQDSPRIASIEDFEGKRIAVLKGSYHEEQFKLYFPQTELIYAEDTLEAMRLVLSKKADATIEYHSVNQYNISRHLFSDLHSIPLEENQYFTSSSQYIGIRNDWPLLVNILDKAMYALSEKEIHQLREKWLDPLLERDVQFDSDELLYLKTKRVLTFCSDPDWLPIEKIEGTKHIGIAADYLQEISANIKLNFRLVPTNSWKESLAFIKEKKCDFLSAVSQTEERSQYLNFSSVYLDMPLVITTRSDTFYIHSLKNLKGKKIALVNNYAYEDILRRDYPHVELLFVPNAYEGLRQVDEGTVYAYVDTLEATSEQLRTSSFSELKISGRLDEGIALSLGVRKDDYVLFDILEKGLNSISAEKRKEIYDKWVYVTVDEGISFALIWKFLLALAVILLFFLYRYKLTLNYNNQLVHINEELERLNLQLEEISQTDQLTGLSNRRHLDKTLLHEVNRSRRYSSTFCIMLIDIDFFKKVNDTYGHPQGDKVLQKVAEILKNNSREIDTVGRWGGEEFLLILTHTDLDTATSVANKLRSKIKAYDFGLEREITASFGVTEFDIGKDTESSILSRVDANLYEAKETGRDKVVSS